MENHYMSLIWTQLYSIKNQSLSVEEQQESIKKILSEMAQYVQNSTKSAMKKLLVSEINKTLENL